jgi:P pilus assembly chaperone PapD
MTRLKILLLGLVTLASYTSFSDLVVQDSIITITDPRQSRRDVVVYNNDETEKLYLEIVPHRVNNPGEDDEMLEIISLSASPEFIVTPNRAILDAKEESIIRMINLNNSGEKELIYRINVTPATPPPELEIFDDELIRPLVEVVIGYQILVMILPDNPNPVVDHKREGKMITFSNPGNTNYLLTEGTQCNPQDPNECQGIPIKRIYPGNNWSFELPYDGPSNYTLRTHAGSSSRVFD